MQNKRWIETLANAVFAIMALVFVAFLWRHNVVLALVLFVWSVLMLSFKRSRSELKLFAIAAFFGAMAEVFAVYFGVWEYANADLVYVPLWLMFLWGIAAVFIVRTYDLIRTIDKEGEK